MRLQAGTELLRLLGIIDAAGAPTEVDPNLKPTYADEWAISYERALAACP